MLNFGLCMGVHISANGSRHHLLTSIHHLVWKVAPCKIPMSGNLQKTLRISILHWKIREILSRTLKNGHDFSPSKLPTTSVFPLNLKVEKAADWTLQRAAKNTLREALRYVTAEQEVSMSTSGVGRVDGCLEDHPRYRIVVRITHIFISHETGTGMILQVMAGMVSRGMMEGGETVGSAVTQTLILPLKRTQPSSLGFSMKIIIPKRSLCVAELPGRCFFSTKMGCSTALKESGSQSEFEM